MHHKVIYEKMGCMLLQPRRFYDDRGFFCEVFNESLRNFLNFHPVQENTSLSSKNVVRGLHMQYGPHTAKLVRVNVGKILDVAVDCRPFSETFGQHIKIELDSKEGHMLYIPSGFAHGFLSIEDNTVVNYHVNQSYNPSGEISVNAFSDSLSIDWQLDRSQVIMSEKDKIARNFEEISWNQFWSQGV